MSESKKVNGGSDGKERRRAPRVQLDKPCFARMHIEGLESYDVMLTDISQQGAQLLLPPQIEPGYIPDGAKLFLYNFPEDLSGFKDREIEGELAWRGVRNCGVSFKEMLDVSVEEFVPFAVKL